MLRRVAQPPDVVLVAVGVSRVGANKTPIHDALDVVLAVANDALAVVGDERVRSEAGNVELGRVACDWAGP